MIYVTVKIKIKIVSIDEELTRKHFEICSRNRVNLGLELSYKNLSFWWKALK